MNIFYHAQWNDSEQLEKNVTNTQWINKYEQGTYFMFKPCIDMTSLNNNQLVHSQFNIY